MAQGPSKSKLVLRLYDRRIVAGLCKYDARENGAPPHEAPTKNRRRIDGRFTMCPACYERRLAEKRRRPRG